MQRIKTHIFYFLFLIPFLSSYGQNKALEELTASLDNLKRDNTLVNASWGFCLKKVSSGELITEYNSKQALTPASTLKIVTTAAALNVLGSQYQWKTYLQYTGSIKDSVLNGDLLIKGGGDPSLDSHYFEDSLSEESVIKWINTIKKAGIKKINGRIIADTEIFEDSLAPATWLNGDVGNYYGAGASGLSCMDNMYTVYFKSGSTGARTKIKNVIPDIKNLTFNNQVIAGRRGSGDNTIIYGREYSFERLIKGSITPNGVYPVKGSMPDPALFYVQYLKEELTKNNIVCNGEAYTSRLLKINAEQIDKKRLTLDTIYSQPLHRIVYFTNLKSNNLFAEHLLKTLSLKKSERGNTKEGTKYVKNYWAQAGIDTSGFVMLDGSGLSPGNKITPEIQTDILLYMAKQPAFYKYYESLPIAGESGTAKSICIGTKAQCNMRAKSGYIGGVRAYTGYITDTSGELLAFSFIINNFSCSPTTIKHKMEIIFAKMAEL
jgi:D-alanyl-D-alanine carboxypeptidase/D-alanyl-D-alanine-endopeptidase (penicillin-binding protein 4)